MHSLPDFSRVEQHIEIRSHKLTHEEFEFTMTGAVKVDKNGDYIFRFDTVKGMEENFVAFKSALISFLENIGLVAHVGEIKKCLQSPKNEL